MGLLAKVGSIFDSFINFLGMLAIVIVVASWLFICFEVVMRYILKSSQIWVLEIVEYGLLYVTFLGAAWLLKNDGHIRMDLVINQLSPRKQALANMITSFLSAVTLLIIVWFTAGTTWDNFRQGILDNRFLELLKGPILIIIPIGSFLFAIQFLRRSNSYLRKWRASKSLG